MQKIKDWDRIILKCVRDQMELNKLDVPYDQLNDYCRGTIIFSNLEDLSFAVEKFLKEVIVINVKNTFNR